jgi:catechol 2,3-dioxygenase-like lactoylglutathione lyase family enzyme
VAELWLHQVGHQLDDVARRAELAVLASGGDLGQQHFVDVTLDVLEGLAFLARVALHHFKYFVDSLHRLHHQCWLGDDKYGVLHVMGEVGFGTVQVFKEGEHSALYVLQHVFGLHVLEFAPAQGALVDFIQLGIGVAFVGFLLGVVAPGFGAVLRRNPFAIKLGGVLFAGEFGIGLALKIQFVEPLHEQQVGDLLNGGEGVANTAAPEFVPELIDLAFEFGVVLQHVIFS